MKVQLVKQKEKENIEKKQEEIYITCRVTGERIKCYFLSETMKVRRQWDDFKILKKSQSNPEFYAQLICL